MKVPAAAPEVWGGSCRQHPKSIQCTLRNLCLLRNIPDAASKDIKYPWNRGCVCPRQPEGSVPKTQLPWNILSEDALTRINPSSLNECLDGDQTPSFGTASTPWTGCCPHSRTPNPKSRASSKAPWRCPLCWDVEAAAGIKGLPKPSGLRAWKLCPAQPRAP